MTALVLVLCGGCAPLPPALLGASNMLSLGSMAVKLSTMDYGTRQVAVGWLPPQYAGNESRLMAETWALNFQFSKKTGWEGEDLSWQEVLAAIGRRVNDTATVLALVHKRPLPPVITREVVTVYKTRTGAELSDPAKAQGEGWYPFAREQSLTIPMYAYTVFFFSKSRQPSGILTAEQPAASPCRTVNATGTYIAAIGKKTPAAHASLQSGDVIVTVNGRPSTPQNIFSLFATGKNNLTICREGRILSRSLNMPP